MAPLSELPKSGDVVGGKYRVERKLGSGGMGVVYEVTHRVTSKRFAIKWLLPEAAAEEGARKRFMREAQVAGRFEHPNVVEVYDIGQDGSSFYMVMELLEGESLGDRMLRVRRHTPQALFELLVPCMEGVAAAHAAGIVHRDLKPANLFVCAARNRQPEYVKVLDFGISKLSSIAGVPDATLTRAGAVMGTPHYMAPEQMRAQAVDARADIYAFGVILYEGLSGRRPFDAETYADLVLQVLSESPKPLRELAPELPSGLCDVVARAMARDPHGRFESMRELVAALEPYYRAPVMAHAASNAPAPLAAAAQTGDRESADPPTPLFSESISSGAPVPVARAKVQYWIAGTFAAGLLIAFFAAVFSRPDVGALPQPAATLPEVHPAPADVDPPELHPDTIQIEREPATDSRTPNVQDAGVATVDTAPVTIEPPAATVEEPPREEVVPRRLTRKSTPSKAQRPKTGTSSSEVRPRVALDRDDFGAN